MKNRIFTHVAFLLLGLFFSFTSSAQQSVTTVPPLAGGNGQTGISFNVKAINSITISEIWSSFYTGSHTVTIWYNTDSISGPPNIAGAGWTALVSNVSVNVAAGAAGSIQQIPGPISLSIPAGATYGFFIQSNNTMYYTGTSSTPPPIAVFSDANMYINTGSNVGYGGPYPNPTFHVRQFNGKIVYTSCTQPSNLNVSNLGPTSATVSWNAITGSTGYEYAVTTSATPPASGTPIAATTDNVTSLTPSTGYYLHVRNFCSATNASSWSTLPFNTPSCASAPTPAITGITQTAANISWTTAPGNNGYEIAVTTSATPPASGTPVTGNSYNASGLTHSTVYYAHLRVNCGSGNYSPWVTVQFVTAFAPCDSPVVTVPIANINAALLSWNTVPNAIGYEYAVTLGNAPPATGTATTNTQETIPGLAANTQYYAHVRAHCGHTNYSAWTTITFTTPATCTPPPQANITNINNHGADADWTAVPGAAGYEYIVNEVPASPTTWGAYIINNAYTPTGLFSGTQYYLHVRTHCGSAGYSPWTSNTFSTVTSCFPPAAPVASSVTDRTAKISWPAVTGATQYEYYIGTSPNTPFAGAYIPSNNRNEDNLAPNTTYYVHVRSYCGAYDLSDWVRSNFTTQEPTGVGSVAASGSFIMEVYPNPVRDVLYINTNMQPQGKATVRLTDVTGKTIRQVSFNGKNAQINMADLADGMYMVNYVDDSRNQTVKINKQ